jgi:hypothetical protein
LALPPSAGSAFSKKHELPVPGESTQQTGIPGDARRPRGDTIHHELPQSGARWSGCGTRTKPGSYVIEQEFHCEAGGAAYDIDGDGDLDIPPATTRRVTNSGGGRIP